MAFAALVALVVVTWVVRSTARGRIQAEAVAREAAHKSQFSEASLRARGPAILRAAGMAIEGANAAATQQDVRTVAATCTSVRDDLNRLDYLDGPPVGVGQTLAKVQRCVDIFGAVSDGLSLLPKQYADVGEYAYASKRLQGLAVPPKIRPIVDATRQELERRNAAEGRRLEQYRTTPRSLQITATEIWRDYDENELAANERYNHSNLVLGGVVGRVSQGLGGEVMVHLLSPDEIRTTAAILRPSETAAASRLRRGVRVTVVCQGSAKYAMTPMLRDCSLRD